jgi:LysR family nod box-dependent transcriptional activator
MDTGGVPLASLDLNLLLALDALLTERSVTRAAQRLNLSQPSLSGSLARLRHHVDDELLARHGNSYELTPLALQLRELTTVALADLERLFDRPAVFDPGRSTREFSVIASDYALIVLGRDIWDLVRKQAPGVRLRFSANTPSLVESAASTLRGVDGLIVPHGFVDEMPHAELFTDDWVCIVSADNGRVGDELTMEDLGELPWILTYNARAAFTSAARQLQMLGVEARVTMVVEQFVVLPFLVVGTDRIALVQSRLVDRLRGMEGLRVLACPYDAIPIMEALWWHPVHGPDPEHAWMRSVIIEAARRIRVPVATLAV